MAWAVVVGSPRPVENGSDVILQWPVLFVGAAVRTKEGAPVLERASMVEVRVTTLDTMATMRMKIIDEIVALATTFGFSVARTAVFLPLYERGV